MVIKKPTFRDLTIKVVGSELRFRFDSSNGLQRWVNRANHFDGAASDMRPVFDEFGVYMLRSITRTFDTEGRPTRWAPLAPSTVKERIRLGYGGEHPILVRTGDLKKGFRYKSGIKFFSITSNIPYMKYHQYGTRKMPKRVMVQMISQDRARFTRIYREHLGV